MTKPTRQNRRDYRHALGRFATGITVITAKAEDIVRGMTCNAFMSISLDPPLVGIAVTHQAHMFQFLGTCSRFGVSILGENQELISTHFAGQHQTDLADPFIEVESMPMIKGANVHLITNIVERVKLGDHTLFVGQVTFYDYQDICQPLLFNAGKYAKLGKSHKDI